MAILLGGALGCFVLPERAAGRARALSAAAVAAVAGLLLSAASLVVPGAHVERSLGELVGGVDLDLRLDAPGLAVGLLACLTAGLALLEGRRRPLERSGLLLCLAGSVTCATAGNAVLLFAGLEVANAGSALLAASGRRGGRWPAAAFAVQHLAALGLLAAALELQVTDKTSDLLSLPGSAIGAAVAAPWALAGAARLLAPLAMPGPGTGASSTAWAAVAAVPTGLLVLLRLLMVSGGHVVRPVAGVLLAIGLLAALAGSAVAVAERDRSGACGRALAVALAGSALVLAGIGGDASTAGLGAVGLALALAVAAAPAWTAAATEGRWAVRLRALTIGAAGGLPVGYTASAIVPAVAAAVSTGPPGSFVGVGLGLAAAGAAVAGALAVRSILTTASGGAPWQGLRPDAAAAAALSLVLGAFPGLAFTLFVNQVAFLGGQGPAAAVDAGATQGPGGGWSGGYLVIAAAVLATALASAASMAGGHRRTTEAAPALPRGAVRVRSAASRLSRGALALRAGSRIDAGLGVADAWLAGQPGIVLVVAGAIACLFLFR